MLAQVSKRKLVLGLMLMPKPILQKCILMEKGNNNHSSKLASGSDWQLIKVTMKLNSA